MERLTFTSLELARLPGRLYRQRKVAGAEQLEILKALCRAQNPEALKDLLADSSEHSHSSTLKSIALVRDAFLAQEPLLADDEQEGPAATVTLRSESDFSDYWGTPAGADSGAQISWQATMINLMFRTTIKQLMGVYGAGFCRECQEIYANAGRDAGGGCGGGSGV